MHTLKRSFTPAESTSSFQEGFKKDTRLLSPVLMVYFMSSSPQIFTVNVSI